jgi:hypothetical protein
VGRQKRELRALCGVVTDVPPNPEVPPSARSRLRWLAPLLSTVVLVGLIVRASSCEPGAREPAVVVPDPDTTVKAAEPAAQVAVQQTPPAAPAAPAAVAETDAGLGASLQNSLPSLRDEAFLGGSKSGLQGLGFGGLGLRGQEPPAAEPQPPARPAGRPANK